MSDELHPGGETRRRRRFDTRAFLQDFANHLRRSLAKDRYSATAHDRYLALAYAVRDRITDRWIETQETYHALNVKRVYYISMEFLLGRSLLNNMVNMGLDAPARQIIRRLGLDWEQILETEPDAGLGNGGLGRLAACFMDSLATLSYPAMGYGLRYEYGIFRQAIAKGAQVEEPDNWLRLGSAWEYARPEYAFPVHFGGHCEVDRSFGAPRDRWVYAQTVLGMPYDMPIVGYGKQNVNTLRLWFARPTEDFDLEYFSKGDYAGAVEHQIDAERLTKVLYPDDRAYAGRELRLRQQYFLISSTLQDILRRHKSDENAIEHLPEKVAIQMNDTHPSLAVAELMRLLMDIERLPIEKAWEITKATLAYTNHTLLPEALEQWPVDMLEKLLPRHLQIIYKINDLFLEEVRARFPGDADRLRRMSLIDESSPRRVRMAYLAAVGSHSVNGVSAIHSNLLKTRVLKDFNDLYPERFNNKTNGVTPRRWLYMCNPDLSEMISGRIGGGWVRDLDRLREFETAAEEPPARDQFLRIKRKAKEALSNYIGRTIGDKVDPDSVFDVQVKRLHEYKRQLLNILHVVLLYQRLREDPSQDMVPRTFIFGAKAAPAYWAAKRIIRLIHAVGRTLEEDPAVRGRLHVVFLPDYRVSLAERIMPAADVSEQISTAGMEASGTGNMKFAINGALTVGTLDGANIEIMEAVGRDNIFIFGLTAEEVAATLASGATRGWEVYEKDSEIHRMLDFLFSSHFAGLEAEEFDRIRQAILVNHDPFLHLADLQAYAEAQAQVSDLYRRPQAWARKAILNVSRAGFFSSDRTIREYADQIWGLKPVQVRSRLELLEENL